MSAVTATDFGFQIYVKASALTNVNAAKTIRHTIHK